MNAKRSLAVFSAVLVWTVGAAEVSVEFYTPSIVRVTRVPDGVTAVKPYPIVTAKPQKVAVAIDDGADARLWKTAACQVALDKKTGTLSFRDAAGQELIREASAGAFPPLTYGETRQTTKVTQKWLLKKGLPVYGLGSVQNGLLDQRNWSGWLRPENRDDGIPFVCGLGGWGLYWDNTSPTHYRGGDEGFSFTSDVGVFEDYYLIAGGTLDGVVRGMRALTGEVPMNALWTYGFWQSRERYMSQQQLLEVVTKYRELGIPLDGIIQDWQYWGDDWHWNAFDFLAKGFPDGKGMVEAVHAQHAKFIISIWCAFGSKTEPYAELDKINGLLDIPTYPTVQKSGAKPYDVFNPAARAVYWKYAERLSRCGLDGWWMDSTEPEPWGLQNHHQDVMTSIGPYRDVRLAYPHAAVCNVASHMRELRPTKRPFILTRSASAGSQRNGANVWSGDTSVSWAALRKQVPCGVSFSLCGNPNWSNDIGGFSMNPEMKGEAFHELYIRWMQYGVFQPLMRSHGSGRARELYFYGKPGEPVYEALLEPIKLRYRLLPYIYSLAHDVSVKGDSFYRPVAGDYPSDEKTWSDATSFLFGHNLLVAPVTTAGVERVSVHLPKGADWYDWFSGRKFAGGQDLAVPVSRTTFPFFVKAGSVLVEGPAVQWTDEKPWDDLAVTVYPGADGSFDLYEDAGDGFGYEKGECTTIRFVWNETSRTLTIGAREGSYPGQLASRRFRVRLLNGAPKIVSYTGQTVKVRF